MTTSCLRMIACPMITRILTIPKRSKSKGRTLKSRQWHPRIGKKRKSRRSCRKKSGSFRRSVMSASRMPRRSSNGSIISCVRLHTTKISMCSSMGPSAQGYGIRTATSISCWSPRINSLQRSTPTTLRPFWTGFRFYWKKRSQSRSTTTWRTRRSECLCCAWTSSSLIQTARTENSTSQYSTATTTAPLSLTT